MRLRSRVLVVALLAWHAADSVAVRPDYLAYFGAQAGGPEAGYKHLVDSSLDWGMDLPELKEWLDEHDPQGRESVFLAYFGTDSPRYHGITACRLPGFFDRRPSQPYALAPGYYAISATLFQGVYLAAYGRWNPLYERLYQAKLRNVQLIERARGNPALRAELLARKPAKYWDNEYRVYDHFRFARLCAWLRHQGEPPAHVGHSIFIWKLDANALHAALSGPPAEMETAPAEWRRIFGKKA